jgi:hypothetical protein
MQVQSVDNRSQPAKLNQRTVGPQETNDVFWLVADNEDASWISPGIEKAPRFSQRLR